MQLLSVAIRNFFTIGESEETIPLCVNDLVLVQGINKDYAGADSNGAGKSLIFESIVWALWGKTVRGYTGDEVVNRKTKRNCTVQLRIKDGSDVYVITRYQKSSESEKPNDLILSKEGGDEQVAHSKAATQSRIDALVGMDFDTLCAMMPGAKSIPASMTDANIKSLLEKILHTGDLPKALAITKEKLRDQKQQLQTLAVKEDLLTQEIEESVARAKEYNARDKSFEEEKAVKIAKLMERLSSLEVVAANYKVEISQCDDLIAGEEDVREELDRLSVKIKEYEAFEIEHDKLYQEDSQKYSSVIAVQKQEIARLRKELKKIENLEGTCAECHQEIDEKHQADLKQKFTKQVAAAQKKYDEAQQAQKLLSVDYNTRLAQIREVMDSSKAELKTQLKLVSDVDKAKDQRKQKQELLDNWQRDNDYIQDELRKLEASTSGFTDLKRKELDVVKVKKKEVKQLVGDKTQHEDEIAKLEFWEKAFSPTGIRSYVLKQVTPVLNERAKHYCKLLSDGEMKIEFSTTTQQKKKVVDKFQIRASFKHGAESWKGVSEGEKARANLVIALALGDLAAYRSHKKLRFRFLDEVFSHVDETGSDAIIRLLKDQREQYGTVFVVTHSPRIQSQFSKTITVTKEHAISTIEVDV